MKVEILTFSGCPTANITADLVLRLCGELGIKDPISFVAIEDEESAREVHFLGSPSVRINGIDVEEARQADQNYGLACRLYSGKQGISGFPPDEQVRAALMHGMEEEAR